MNEITVEQLARYAHGKLSVGSQGSVCAIVTDTRKVTPGCAFVALRGDTHDGHHFAADAVANGASVAVVERELPGLPTLVVSDTRQALRDLGAAIRSTFDRCRVVGVAGSNGKTTTKHLIAAAIGSRLRGNASPKSFNNDIGVPLTIFEADPASDFCILELGTNHPGEIRTLTHIARPDVCVITNCSAEHLEGLGDLDGVRRENVSVIEGMSDRGTLIVHGDDEALVAAVAGFRGKLIRFGLRDGNDLVARDVRVAADGTRFTLNGREVFVPMVGRHFALNALAAIAVARAFGLDDADAIAGLSKSTKPEMRLDLREANGVTVLDDAYNANPASMAAALDTLLAMPGRRIAVLGEMREMGDHSERLHRELGALVASHAGEIEKLICVGPMGRWIAEAAGGEATCFETSADAAAFVASIVRRGDVVLVKGSRGVRMERVVERLLSANRPA